MKRLFAILLLVVLLCSLLSVSAFARNYIISPEKTPDSKPASPQTGYAFDITAVAAVFVLSGGVAVLTLKKVCG